MVHAKDDVARKFYERFDFIPSPTPQRCSKGPLITPSSSTPAPASGSASIYPHRRWPHVARVRAQAKDIDGLALEFRIVRRQIALEAMGLEPCRVQTSATIMREMPRTFADPNSKALSRPAAHARGIQDPRFSLGVTPDTGCPLSRL